MDKLTLFSLAVFLILFGLFAVTNVEVLWGRGVMGLAALVAGVICLVRGLR